MADFKWVDSARLPTRWGLFELHGFGDKDGRQQAVALTMGDVSASSGPEQAGLLCRIHSECLTGDAFASLRCDCGPQLHLALETIAQQGTGMLIYLPQEGRGVGLLNKVKAYALQDEGLDTVDANLRLGLEEDAREYSMATAMLRHFGVHRLRLMTNNPAKVEAMERDGFTVVERVPLLVEAHPENAGYLAAKKHRMGHLFNLVDDPGAAK